MPWSLKRFQETGQLHYITFSCYRRKPNLGTPHKRRIVEEALERVRIDYRMLIFAYVVMPEHVHLLVSEPEEGGLPTAMQSLKQGVARRLALRDAESFWEPRYYDFNVFSEAKRIDKIKYIHRNPVKRGLCAKPEDWEWSSFRHYATGEIGVVEIESEWTFRRREKAGRTPQIRRRQKSTTPPKHEA